MKQRERLIELLNFVKCKAESCGAVDGGRCGDLDKLDRCQIEAIADNLLANGVIVPPCKAGDTVYRIVKLLNDETKIVEGKVFEIAISYERHSVNECHFYFWANGEEFTRRHYSIWCDFADFGKTVFLSRELAEKALAERSKG